MIKLKGFSILFSVLILAGCAIIKGDWEKARSFNTVGAYQEFLKKHPQSEFSDEAKSKIHNLDWQEAKRLGTSDSYQGFMNKYPQSEFIHEAKTRIQNLDWQRAKQIDTIETYKKFISRYPRSEVNPYAKDRILALEWDKTKQLDTIEAYQVFLQKYPQSEFASGAKRKIDSKKQEKAWGEVNSMDATSLHGYLETFPDGQHADEAKIYLSMHNKIAAIKNNQEKPDFVIPFQQFGERWESWKKSKPEKGILGIFVGKTDFGLSKGVFRAMGGGKTSFGVYLDAYGTPAAPTGEGSIIAFQTNGLKLEYIGSIIFETPGDEAIYFGVVHGVGLVHLHGEGKVTMPDGTEAELK